jgi:site-specific recombinase XerD
MKGEPSMTENDSNAEGKPMETKPAEIKPTETAPTEAKPAEAKPSETKPFYLDFLEEYAMRGRERTLKTYLALLQSFESWLKERGRTQFDRQDVLEYLAGRQNWSNKSKNVFLSAIRTWARWARGYAEDGPTQARLSRIESIRRFPVVPYEKTYLTMDQLKTILTKAQVLPDDYCLLWLLLWFGLRVGELNLIRSINYQSGEIVIETEKAGGTRKLFFDEYTAALLRYAQERGLLAMSPARVWKRLRKYKAYAEGFSPHSCRHTFATFMAKVADRDVLRKMLGHRPGTVTDIYVHVSDEEVREVMLNKHYLKPFEVVGNA